MPPPGAEAFRDVLDRLGGRWTVLVLGHRTSRTSPMRAMFPVKHRCAQVKGLLIDGHHREWHAKPVGFVSYGGTSGGLPLRGVAPGL